MCVRNAKNCRSLYASALHVCKIPLVYFMSAINFGQKSEQWLSTTSQSLFRCKAWLNNLCCREDYKVYCWSSETSDGRQQSFCHQKYRSWSIIITRMETIWVVCQHYKVCASFCESDTYLEKFHTEKSMLTELADFIISCFTVSHSGTQKMNNWKSYGLVFSLKLLI